jgi:hypothetical protein
MRECTDCGAEFDNRDEICCPDCDGTNINDESDEDDEDYWIEKYGMVEDCPDLSNIENDCSECCFSPEFHYEDGECVRRLSVAL